MSALVGLMCRVATSNRGMLSSHTMQGGAIEFGHPGETLCCALWQFDKRVTSGFGLRSRAPLEIAIFLFTRINNDCLGMNIDLDMICSECQLAGPRAPQGQQLTECAEDAVL